MEKKHLIIIIILLIICFGIYVFLNPWTKGQVPKTNTICMDYSNYAPSELSAALVKSMVSNYKSNQLQSIKTSSTHPMADDAHSIWFDMDTLKKFIYHIEKSVLQNAPSTTNKLGIRIYYASYPENSLWGRPGYEDLSTFIGDSEKMQYTKMHTLVMIPTILNGTEYCDFNPKDKASYIGYRKLWGNSQGTPPPAYKAVVLTANSSTSDDIGARNHGQLIPPGNPLGEGF
jgi:hypothetical protein